MPKASFGPAVKAKVKLLLGLILDFANHEIEWLADLNIECRWTNGKNGSPELVVQTTLRDLELLSSSNTHGEKLTQSFIRTALQLMRDFLEILEDHRVKTQGSGVWCFTLKLWSINKAINLEHLDQEWENRRSGKSKQQAAVVYQSSSLEEFSEFRPSFQAPPLPAHYIARPKHLQDIKASLLRGTTSAPGTLIVSVIHGLGGIGKSVLAVALAHDSEVQEQFPDGILWATLGQQPDLLALLGGWIQSLGDYAYQPTTPQAASSHLRTLLHSKKALLVVDDAWSPEHVDLFSTGGAGCQLLVTTREALISGAFNYYLDKMTSVESLMLLERALGRPVNQFEQQQAIQLAHEVGYLPLALELAAAQVADGVTWDELLAELQLEIARLEVLDLPGAEDITNEAIRKRFSLLTSLNLSLRQLSLEQLNQFAWLGVLPEEVSISQNIAAILWDSTTERAGKILRFFRWKGLLIAEPYQPSQKPTYRIYESVHDVAKRLIVSNPTPTQSEDLPGLGLTLPAAHAILLDRYHSKTQDESWHTFLEHEYIHAYYGWHLQKAELKHSTS